MTVVVALAWSSSPARKFAGELSGSRVGATTTSAETTSAPAAVGRSTSARVALAPDASVPGCQIPRAASKLPTDGVAETRVGWPVAVSSSCGAWLASGPSLRSVMV